MGNFFNIYFKLIEKSTPLVIKAAQLKTLDLLKKIFGKSPVVFMSRQQLSNLAGEVYRALKIMQEYLVSEFEFNEEFIKLIAKENFTLVPLENSIKHISKYGINPKTTLKLDALKKEASNLFKIDKEGNYSFVNLGKPNKNLEILFGSKTARIVEEYLAAWKEANRTLDAQIYDLNYWVRNEIEWQNEGSRLVPKSLNVLRLAKSAFPSSLKFSTVSKRSIKADYLKEFNLEAN